jgi:hypothetical protein
MMMPCFTGEEVRHVVWLKNAGYLIPVIMAIFIFFTGFMTEEEKNASDSLKRKIFEGALRVRVLALLYVFLIMGILFISSFTITPASGEEQMSVRIASGLKDLAFAKEESFEGKEPTRFPQFIVPWGRMSWGEPGGYFPDSVILYPWKSTEVTAGKFLSGRQG